MASAVRLGVVPVDLSTQPLSNEQLALFQEVVIDTSIEMSNSGVWPSFSGSHLRSGWLTFICADSSTAEWMRSNFERIRAKCGLNVPLVEEGSFSKSHIVRGFSPQSLELSSAKILATITSQNAELQDNTWKVVQREKEGALLHLVLGIDDASMKRLNFLKGKINYRFSFVKLILKSTDKVSASDSGTVETAKAVSITCGGNYVHRAL